jgi:hypothetical protein
LAKFDAVELRHEAVTHCFRSDARLVGYEEHCSLNHGNLSISGIAAAVLLNLTYRWTSSSP